MHARAHSTYTLTGFTAHLFVPPFYSRVKDIHDTLDITVYSGDGSKGSEFVGMVTIPLLRVSNMFVQQHTVCLPLTLCYRLIDCH